MTFDLQTLGCSAIKGHAIIMTLAGGEPGDIWHAVSNKNHLVSGQPENFSGQPERSQVDLRLTHADRHRDCTHCHMYSKCGGECW